MSNQILPRRSLFREAPKKEAVIKKEAVFVDENLSSAQKIGNNDLTKNCACVDDVVSNTAALWHEYQRGIS